MRKPKVANRRIRRLPFRNILLGTGLAFGSTIEGCSLNHELARDQLPVPPSAHSLAEVSSVDGSWPYLGSEVVEASHRTVQANGSAETAVRFASESAVSRKAEFPYFDEDPELRWENGGEIENASGIPRISLAELESLALANNPAIKELAATTQKAAGFRTQASLKPNPVVGYQGQQIADAGTDQHLVFAEQEFVTAGKLALGRRVQNEALRAQVREMEAQRLRVCTDLRILFSQALAFQRQLDLIHEFSSVTDKGLEIAEARKQAAEGTQVDVLQAAIQKSQISLALRQTDARLAGTWTEIAAVTGVPDLPYAKPVGDLPDESQIGDGYDWNQLGASLVANSPEYSAAQARISQAFAALQRHEVQAIPNLTVQLGAGRDNGTGSGMMNLQVGAPIPVFNQNQGNIAAARAEICRAQMEAKRIENHIRARLAAVSREYGAAAAAVAQYGSEILPSSKASLDLAEQAYQVGETNFIQVLIARRTFFDSNLQYVTAQADLAIAKAKLDGYLLTGGLDSVADNSGDDSLRGFTFSQQ